MTGFSNFMCLKRNTVGLCVWCWEPTQLPLHMLGKSCVLELHPHSNLQFLLELCFFSGVSQTGGKGSVSTHLHIYRETHFCCIDLFHQEQCYMVETWDKGKPRFLPSLVTSFPLFLLSDLLPSPVMSLIILQLTEHGAYLWLQHQEAEAGGFVTNLRLCKLDQSGLYSEVPS